MDKNTVEGSIQIHASPAKVWAVLTQPEQIAHYTGSRFEGDWSKGSALSWSGEMHGTPYRNKGQVLENKAETLLQFSYWSGMGGDADLPENYSEITYTLSAAEEGATTLTYSRTKIPTAMEQQIFEGHLPYMLAEIKQLAEA